MAKAEASVEERVGMVERGELHWAEVEAAEDLARLLASFMALRDAVAYI
jgi:hypothetical protein